MRVCLLASIACFSTAYAIGQISPVPQPASPSISASSLTLVALINKDVNTKNARIGDEVTVTVIQDLVSAGKVVVRRGSKFIGHVSDVMPFTKTEPRSRLGMVFDRGELKGSGVLSVHGFIQALAPPLSNLRLEAIMSSSTYGGAVSGHPVNGGLASPDHTNAPTSMADSRHTRGSMKGLTARQQSHYDAEHAHPQEAVSQGALSAGNHGVFGMPGLGLSNATSVPVVIAVGQNIDLKSGTQIVLRLDDLPIQQ